MAVEKVKESCKNLESPLAGVSQKEKGQKDNMGWSGWVEFRNLTPYDKTNLQEQK